MRFLPWRYLAAMLLCAGLASCESRPATVGTPAAASAAPADSATSPAVAAAYVCPMACEGSASDKPGKCPVCEMELEPNPAYKAAAQ